jgi:heme/copper-type cytochrome/quinol oxidase subunit 2
LNKTAVDQKKPKSNWLMWLLIGLAILILLLLLLILLLLLKRRKKDDEEDQPKMTK